MSILRGELQSATGRGMVPFDERESGARARPRRTRHGSAMFLTAAAKGNRRNEFPLRACALARLPSELHYVPWFCKVPSITKPNFS